MGRKYSLLAPNYTEHPVLRYVEHLEIGDQLTDPIWLDGSTSGYSDAKPLKTLIIGKSVTEVGDFTKNSSLEYIKIKQQTPPPAKGFSNYIYLNTILYVPKGSKSAYENASKWEYFWHIEEYSDDSGLNEIIPELSELSIQLCDSYITITGLNEGEEVALYNYMGVQLYKCKSHNGTAMLRLNESDRILIIAIRDKSIKIAI